MNWTRKAPKENGAYWLFQPKVPCLEIVQIREEKWHPGRFSIMPFGSDDGWTTEDLDIASFWWMGPIPPPEPPQLIPAQEVV